MCFSLPALKAATFGHQDSDESYAAFSVPDSHKEALTTNNDISFFFRTRHSNGLMYYVGGDPVNPTSNHTFIVIELYNGHVQIRLKFSDDEAETVIVPETFADGQQHFLRVIRTNSTLRVRIADRTHEFELTGGATVLSATHVYLGGLPSGVVARRRKRDTIVRVDAYRGTIQDARQNEHLLSVFAENTTAPLPPAYDIPKLMNVELGEVSDDMCGSQMRCENNATCENVFFSDYR